MDWDTFLEVANAEGDELGITFDVLADQGNSVVFNINYEDNPDEQEDTVVVEKLGTYQGHELCRIAVNEGPFEVYDFKGISLVRACYV